MGKGYSTTGVVVHLARTPVDGKSLTETVEVASTFEVEHMALSNAWLRILYLRHLLKRIDNV